jgi:hypothetical protein
VQLCGSLTSVVACALQLATNFLQLFALVGFISLMNALKVRSCGRAVDSCLAWRVVCTPF